MKEIEKCANDECPLSWNCWRYNSPPDRAQSYSDFKPDEEGECEMYLDMDDLKTDK